MTAVQQRTVSEVLVHTARTLPDEEGGWQRRFFLRCIGASDGCGNILGEATLVQDYGILKPALDGQGVNVLDFGIEPDLSHENSGESLEGLLVRLTKRDQDGTETAFWYGVIHGHTVAPAGDIGGKAQWRAVGLTSVLDQITINNGWVMPASGTDAYQPGYLPPFNKITNGDRSASTYNVNGLSCYVHDLITVDGTGNYWTARQILDLLLAGFSQPLVNGSYYGWSWTLLDPDGCLSYRPESLDLDGMTLLEAVNALVNQRRGLTWYVSVLDEGAFINVVSTVPEAIAVGSFSLPESGLQASLNTTGNVWISDLVIDRDASTTCDILEIHGAHPWAGMTLEYPTQLERTWTDDEATAWEVASDASTLDKVWRNFKIKADWDGTNVFDTLNGLNNTLERSAAGDAAYGDQGYTGERSWEPDNAPPSAILKTERELPIGIHFDDNRLGLRQPPVLVFYDGSAGADSYQDVTAAESCYHVQIDDEPPQIVIGTEDNGQDAEGRLDGISGAKFWITMGIREALPLKVSWQRPSSEWPRAVPRVKVIKVPHAELRYVLIGSVTGVNDDGSALNQLDDTITVRDDRDSMRAILALARAWYEEPSVRCSWTDRGNLDTDATYAPATLLTTVVRGDTFTVNNVITRRTWSMVERDGCEMWDTSYETARIVPDLAGVI